MSFLTSQLNNKNSPVRHFFAEFEEKDGMKSCLALLQSTVPVRPLSFTPPSPSVASAIGTTVDCLIRYTAGGNNLRFEDTDTHRILEDIKQERHLCAEWEQRLHAERERRKKAKRERRKKNPPPMDERERRRKAEQEWRKAEREWYEKDPPPMSSRLMDIMNLRRNVSRHLEDLCEIGQRYLDGRDATTREAVYSATAVILANTFAQLNILPKMFSRDGETVELLNEYFETLGGERYTREISGLIRIFIRANKDPKSELFGAKMIVGANTFLHRRYMRARIDCFFENKDRLILTDIKTLTTPLAMMALRQIIGYALLRGEEEDDFKITDIGIYHARSGSFRFLPLDGVIEIALPGLKSVGTARKVFSAFLSSKLINARYGYLAYGQGSTGVDETGRLRRIEVNEIYTEQELRDEIAKIVAEIEAGE